MLNVTIPTPRCADFEANSYGSEEFKAEAGSTWLQNSKTIVSCGTYTSKPANEMYCISSNSSEWKDLGKASDVAPYNAAVTHWSDMMVLIGGRVISKGPAGQIR